MSTCLLYTSYVVIYRFASPLYAKMQSLLDKLNLYFKEGLTGVKVIRAFSKEKYEMKKYEAVNKEYADASIKAGTIMGFFIPILTMLISFATLEVYKRQVATPSARISIPSCLNAAVIWRTTTAERGLWVDCLLYTSRCV